MAGHLASAFPPPALVARIGGDEFAILVPYAQEDRILAALEKLHASVAASAKAGGTGLPEDFEPAISVGWVMAHSFDMVNSALVQADEAMYSEKRQKNPGR
jgi:diguanylate cyclase (GGDEF)-like protein